MEYNNDFQFVVGLGITLPQREDPGVAIPQAPPLLESATESVLTELLPRTVAESSTADSVPDSSREGAPAKKRTRTKKEPIYRRPVCSLKSAELEENYTMSSTKSEVEIIGIFKVRVYQIASTY